MVFQTINKKLLELGPSLGFLCSMLSVILRFLRKNILASFKVTNYILH